MGYRVLFLQVDISQIIIHEADEPDAGVDFHDADGLAGERVAEIDFLVVEAEVAAAGHDDGPVVERVAWNLGLKPRRPLSFFCPRFARLRPALTPSARPLL
jgi:hypothetical protein